MAMDFDNGGVNHGVFHVGLIRHRLKKPLKNISFYPIPVALEDRIPVAKLCRQITPGAAGARNPQNSFKKQPIIAATASRVARFAQTMRFHLRPLGLSQYESVHPKLESQPNKDGNPESQQTLDRLEAVSVLQIEAEIQRFPADWLPPGLKEEFIAWWSSAARKGRVNDIKMGVENGTYL